MKKGDIVKMKDPDQFGFVFLYPVDKYFSRRHRVEDISLIYYGVFPLYNDLLEKQCKTINYLF
jgi:hypothetical protein